MSSASRRLPARRWAAGLVCLFAAALLGAALMRTDADTAGLCQTWPEPVRPLDGRDGGDSAHLAQDLAAIHAAADRFAASVARRPRLSDSIDARAGAATAPARARAWCEAVLLEQVAAVHGVPVSLFSPPPAPH